MSRDPDISIRIFSAPEFLRPVRVMVDALASQCGFDDHSCGLISLAMDEALANVMRHGYKGQRDGRIWISAWAQENPDALEIVVEDLGVSVDPGAIRGRDLDDVRPGGLGVHFIRHTMDECSWEQRPGGGMRLRMLKRVPAAAHEPAR
jgi:anti-sigma regulatory factor (Ser/Thr protein kinase)